MSKLMDVKLIAYKNVDPDELSAYVASICYQEAEPEWGADFDVINSLFKPGHHTTLQHFDFTFFVDGLAVGDITLGMHLTHPFYNTDQRSGRYTSKMFLNPDYGKMRRYIKKHWPEVSKETTDRILRYIKKSMQVYQVNKEKSEPLVSRFLKEERPLIKPGMLARNAPKIAQEQMRMFIPVIFPTCFAFTVNETALAAMYRSAWTPAMRYVTSEMVRLVLKEFPRLKYLFQGEKNENDWSPEFLDKSGLVCGMQSVDLLHIDNTMDFTQPKKELMHPLDQLHFRPEMMDNNVDGLKTRITLSLATMGQDQRHRTIRRSKPKFTGDFYLPPVPTHMGLDIEAEEIVSEWLSLTEELPGTLGALIAPYGAMMTYTKNGSFNAIAHEQAKRLCFCAQEEIYHLGRSLRLKIKEREGVDSPLVKLFEPHCYETGECAEGDRCCGRSRSKRIRNEDSYFPLRKV